MPLYGIGSRRWLLLVGASCVLVFLFYLFSTSHEPSSVTTTPAVHPEKGDKASTVGSKPNPITLTGSRPVPQLSPEYTTVPDTQSAYCRDRFDVPYLEKLRDSAVEYCTRGSSSKVTCFHTATTDDRRIDSLCLGTNAVFDGDARKYQLGCELGDLTAQAAHVPYSPGLHELKMYWYETGPGVVFDSYINVDGEFKPAVPSPRTPQYTLLVKREGATNVWHCLMELYSMTMTIDVLRLTQRPDTQTPYLTASDVDHTQVVLLDDAEDGPFFDLWSLFSRRPILRLKDLPPGTQLENVIVPLAGASNPMWQGDWSSMLANTRDFCRPSPGVSSTSTTLNLARPRRTPRSC